MTNEDEYTLEFSEKQTGEKVKKFMTVWVKRLVTPQDGSEPYQITLCRVTFSRQAVNLGMNKETGRLTPEFRRTLRKLSEFDGHIEVVESRKQKAFKNTAKPSYNSVRVKHKRRTTELASTADD